MIEKKRGVHIPYYVQCKQMISSLLSFPLLPFKAEWLQEGFAPYSGKRFWINPIFTVVALQNVKSHSQKWPQIVKMSTKCYRQLFLSKENLGNFSDDAAEKRSSLIESFPFFFRKVLTVWNSFLGKNSLYDEHSLEKS